MIKHSLKYWIYVLYEMCNVTIARYGVLYHVTNNIACFSSADKCLNVGGLSNYCKRLSATLLKTIKIFLVSPYIGFAVDNVLTVSTYMHIFQFMRKGIPY